MTLLVIQKACKRFGANFDMGFVSLFVGLCDVCERWGKKAPRRG